MTISTEDKELLIENKNIISDITHGYNNAELKLIFGLHNRIYNENSPPTSCGSCIRTVVLSLQKALIEIMK